MKLCESVVTPPRAPRSRLAARRLMSDWKVEMADDSLSEFTVEFAGPVDSPYEGGVWRVHVELPEAYPYKSPSVGFANKMWHPNVDWGCVSSFGHRVAFHLAPLTRFLSQRWLRMLGRHQPDVEPHVWCVSEAPGTLELRRWLTRYHRCRKTARPCERLRGFPAPAAALPQPHGPA